MLSSTLVAGHLLPYDGLSLPHFLLTEIARVCCRYLGSDGRSGVPVPLRHSSHCEHGQQDLIRLLLAADPESLSLTWFARLLLRFTRGHKRDLCWFSHFFRRKRSDFPFQDRYKTQDKSFAKVPSDDDESV